MRTVRGAIALNQVYDSVLKQTGQWSKKRLFKTVRKFEVLIIYTPDSLEFRETVRILGLPE